MTKAKGKERAKARAKDNALKKIKKRLAKANEPDNDAPSTHFNPSAQSIKGPHTNNRVASAGAGRGAARSK